MGSNKWNNLTQQKEVCLKEPTSRFKSSNSNNKMDISSLVNQDDNMNIEATSFVFRDRDPILLQNKITFQLSDDSLIETLFKLRDGENNSIDCGRVECDNYSFPSSPNDGSVGSDPSDSFYNSNSSGAEEEDAITKRRNTRDRKEKTIPWNDQFKRLSDIVKSTGKLPSFQTKNAVIWRWLDLQCDQRQQGQLSSVFESKLLGLGFDFVRSDQRRTPKKNHKKRFPLSSWIHAQRTQYRKRKLAANRIELLNKLGFNWEPMKSSELEELDSDNKPVELFSPVLIPESLMIDLALSQQALQREQIWIENYEKLFDFKQKYGHLRVPTDEISARDYF